MRSCFGGASFLMFTTLSTIWVPIKTGFTSSSPLECPRLLVITDFTLPLDDRRVGVEDLDADLAVAVTDGR
ncbi:hypothetical protein HanPI659440_Chr06g0241881 [Helianthus annuus]|nr:hypothetical protein HanPI659440_Chr06g0241881 [Helianthus annuus]